ncbi:hypothetical protein CF319_g7792 [Tilletia indica]|nr:hypothetical protein CF319_g7792 [Tilletia indica]
MSASSSLSSFSGPPMARRLSDPTARASQDKLAMDKIASFLVDQPAMAKLAMSLVSRGFKATSALQAAQAMMDINPALQQPPATRPATPAQRRSRANSNPSSPSPKRPAKRARASDDTDLSSPHKSQKRRSASPEEEATLPFITNRAASNTVAINELWPAASAIRKITRGEFVQMWFFTTEGCQHATGVRNEGREDTMVPDVNGVWKKVGHTSSAREDW